MNKREIIFTVLEKLNVTTSESNITEELVSSMIDTKRAMLIKQQYSKTHWNIPNAIKQELCLTLETVDTIEGFSGAGKTIRTKEPIPLSVKIKGRTGPLLVRKLDGSALSINIIPIERIPYIGHNRFLAQLTYSALDLDGRMVFLSRGKNLSFLKEIRVTDIFENPEEAFEMQCSDIESELDSWDREYPVELSMVNPIVDMIVKELLPKIQIPEDNINDSDDGRQAEA